MPKPRPQVPPLPLLNGYAAAVTSNNQLNQRRQQLATSRSSGAIPCTNMAVPLAQVNTSMRRYSAAAAASTPEYFMDPKNVNLSNGAGFNRAPYPPPSTMVQLPYNGDLNKESESSKLNMREYSSSIGAQFNNSQPNNISDACSSASFQVGMKEVPSWLKGLRLHKYTQLFQQMSYVEMMGMDDQQLEHRQVTKGARKKILQSIQKLRERVSLLKQLEACIDENGDTRCLIFELRAMMSTPIWSTSKENQESLPHHICRILQRLHNHLFDVNGSSLPPYPPTNSTVPHSPLIQNVSSELSGLEDEYVVKLIQTYDKVVNHEAFTPSQKQIINQQRRVLRMYAQQQYIQYSNPQFRHFSSIANYSTANINNKPASNIVRAADWMVQPPYKSPAMHSSLSEHHQHRHSLMHTPNQESSPAPPVFATVRMAGIKNNGGFSTSHSRFAGLEGSEKSNKMTETEHRNGIYAEKVQLTQQLPAQPSQPFWTAEHPQRPPQQVPAMVAAKPPPHACFSQPIPAKNWPEKTETNGCVAEKTSPAGCWTGVGDKKRVEGQGGWTDVCTKMEQASSQLSYPQLLLSMLSSMPEFRDLLEKSIYSKNNKKASMQTAATQTGHELRFQESALNNPAITDRPLTAEEKLQFVNEFFIQNSPEKEMQMNSSSCWQQSYSETLAKQLANLQLAKQEQETKSKPVVADTYGSAFDAWIPLTANTIPVESIHEPILPVKTSFQSSLGLSQPSLSLSNISSGYSSSTCSETERASSPGLMVYNFNDYSKCSSKLCEPELPSICPSFDKCAQVGKEDSLSGLAHLPENLESTDSAIRWYEQLSPSGSFNQNSKTESQQAPFAYTSPPPTLFFSQVGHNPYPNMVKESRDWRQQQQTNNNPIYDQQQTMWFGEPTHRLTKHSPSPLRQNNNATTQQQLSTHLWSAAPEMRAVH